MKIAFIMVYKNSPYIGVVRPFINWAKELSKNIEHVEIILFKVGEYIGTKLKDLKFTNFNNIRELSEFINEKSFDFIVTDDYIENLKLFKKITTRSKKVVYAQVLYGTHTITAVHNPVNILEKVLFLAIKPIPFTLFRKKYLMLMKNVDIVIANSNITATLLHILYGIEPDGIVYPPVDINVFKSYNAKKENQVLLYLGSYAGDTDKKLVMDICEVLKRKNIKIFVIGNKTLADKLSKIYEVISISGVSDEELAKIYSKCKLTICPQKWEQFGYVVAESIACGTPVLAFNIMGPKEIIEHTNFGLLANNKREFLIMLDKYLDDYDGINNIILTKKYKYLFNVKNSTKHLIKILSISEVNKNDYYR